MGSLGRALTEPELAALTTLVETADDAAILAPLPDDLSGTIRSDILGGPRRAISSVRTGTYSESVGRG